MLRAGRDRRTQVPFVAGDATALPYADDTFDAVTISYGLRNVEDTSAALRELQDQIQALRKQLEELNGRVFEYEPAAVRAAAADALGDLPPS